MADYDLASILVGTIAGAIFSIVAALLGFPGPGILSSNFIAGFVASYVAREKTGYILKGGLSGIFSSVAVLIAGLLLSGTPVAFSSWDVFGLVSLGLSIGGAGFFIGIIGGYSAFYFSR